MLETELGLTPSPPLGREGQRTACPAGIHKGCWGCGSVLMDKVGGEQGVQRWEDPVVFQGVKLFFCVCRFQDAWFFPVSS